MKRIIPIIASLLSLCLGTALAAEPATARQYDPGSAVRAALAVSPEVLAAQADVDAAKAAVQIELAKLAPGCTIAAEYEQAPYSILGSPTLVRTTVVTFTVGGSRSGFLPRFIGEKTASAAEQALWDVADVEAALAQARITAATATIEKYLAALEADELVDLNNGALDLAKEDERIARASLEAGTVTALDTLKAASNREEAALNLAEAEENRQLAYESLRLQLGLAFGTEIALAPVPVSQVDQAVDLEALVAAALRTRAEVLAKRTAVRKAESNLAACRNEALPTLKVFGAQNQGDYALTVSLDLTSGALEWSAGGSFATSDTATSTRMDDEEDGLSLGLSFTWHPFDGGAQRASVAAAQAGLASGKIALGKAENGIRLELRQLTSDLNLAQLRLAQAEKEKALAERTRELALVRYREGVGLFSDLADATQALAEAKVAVVRKEHALILAYAHLEQACGGMPGLAKAG